MSDATIKSVAGALFAQPSIKHIQERVRLVYGREVWITISEDRIVMGAANKSGSAHCEINMGDVGGLDPALLGRKVKTRLIECAKFIGWA